MKVLGDGPAPRPDRATSAILHDEENARIIGFTLNPGQEIPLHRSNSSVIVHVREGSGEFRGESGGETLSVGQSAIFSPGETHAIIAGNAGLKFVAVIAPRPGG